MWKEAEERLEVIGILCNRQSIPTDISRKMSEASGLRIGTAWATSRGYDQSDFEEISKIIYETLSGLGDKKMLLEISEQVKKIATKIRVNDVW